MTPLQYERWKDFALRMARTCYATSRRPSCEWIVGLIEQFFERFDPLDIPVTRDWDHSDDYPEGHPYHQVTGYWFCGRGAYCGRKNCDGTHLRYSHGPLVGDSVSEMLADEGGNFYFRPDIDPGEDESNEAFDARWEKEAVRCEESEAQANEQWDLQYGGPVHCCIRAGLDLACEPSMGVLGFTAGDLRKMYPEGVPDWVSVPGQNWYYWPDGEENGTFAEMGDEVGVLL